MRCLIAICEKGFISLWILELWICKSWRCLVVGVWIVPLIPTVTIMGDSIIQPIWNRSEWRMVYSSSFWFVASTWNLSLQ